MLVVGFLRATVHHSGCGETWHCKVEECADGGREGEKPTLLTPSLSLNSRLDSIFTLDLIELLEAFSTSPSIIYHG